jgi:hypothetical protein
MLAKLMSYSSLRVAVQLLAVLSLVTVGGCGDGKLAVYSVSGVVKVDSKPADGAMVIFCPTDGSEELLKLRPYAFTDPDGKYQLTTFDQGDGAPAGNYKVIIQWPAKTGADQRGGTGPDRLRGRYMNLERSQLTAKVDDDTEVPPFELTSK